MNVTDVYVDKPFRKCLECLVLGWLRARVGVQAMAAQGSGGAFEISQRMTAMLGWGATTKFSEDWTWNQAAETYALDPEMAAQLRKNNPQVCLERTPY